MICEVPERSVMMDLFHSTNGESWIKKENWGTEKPLCDWFGVKVDIRGKVAELNLMNNNLQGE